MEKKDIEELRAKVSCAALLEKDGWKVDLKESTRRAIKYRRTDGAIIIVIHDGKGWFDPLSEAKGDVFSLVSHLDGVGFSEACDRVGNLVGFVPTEPAWQRPSRSAPPASVPKRWTGRTIPRSGSPTWRYLAEERALPAHIIQMAIEQDRLRDGPRGSMWAAHTNDAGNVIGWEERGPDWRGFAAAGAKELFRFGASTSPRICVTEAAIDAMSLAGIEGARSDTLYVSTGGGWAPATEVAIRGFSAQPNVVLVAATDNNLQGDHYGERIRAIAQEAGCRFDRLRPHAEDWNEQLQAASPR